MPRLLLPLIAVLSLLLGGCSMEAMADKLLPSDVRAEADAQIDRLIAGETQFIFDAFPDERDNPEFREQMTRMVANIPDSPVVSRDIVGVQARTEQSYSATQGAVRTGTYNLAQELKFENGEYLLVQLAHTLDADGECCVLRAINAQKSDTSPYLEGIQQRSLVMRIVGVLFLMSTLVTGVFLIIRIGGRKAREAQMGG